MIFDQFSRYKSCSDIIEKLCPAGTGTILDVGSGESCLLGEFLPNHNITYLDPLLVSSAASHSNRIASDIFGPEISGRKFDLVVSIDTFEHVAPEQRGDFLQRLNEIAEKHIVISCPCSDDVHAAETDRYLNETYRSIYGHDYPWLEEHFRYGLPRAKEIQEFLKDHNWFTTQESNGYAPWLRELLAYTLCGLEFPEFLPTVLSISKFFNEQLYKFDCCAPGYRQIVIASKEPIALETNHMPAMPPEASDLWEQLRQQVIAGVFGLIVKRKEQGQEQMVPEGFYKQILDRDAEIGRLGALVSQLSSWGKKLQAEVDIRDTEILRLNRIIQRVGAGSEQND